MTSGLVCGTGPLPGLAQTVPRAELRAALFAMQWALLNRVCLALWSDSAYVVDGVHQLCAGDEIPEHWDNQDMWETVYEVVFQLGCDRFKCRHVPSHLDVALCEDDFEAWVARGNNWADTQADLTNRSRPQPMVSIHSAALGHFQERSQEIRDLRRVYLSIAEITGTRRHVDSVPVEEDTPVIWQDRDCTLSDALHPTWRFELAARGSAFPIACLESISEVLFELDEGSPMCTAVSWVELAFVFKSQGYSFWHRARSTWEIVGDSFHEPRPTLSGCLDFLRKSCTDVLKGLGREDLFVSGMDLTGFGVSIPCDGLLLGIAFDVLREARTDLKLQAASRPFRKAADFSRAF